MLWARYANCIWLCWLWTSVLCSTSLTLTRWGRVTHICVGETTIICSDNGLSPGRRQAIIWTNAGILLIGPLGTNFIEILIGTCLGLNVLNQMAWEAACTSEVLVEHKVDSEYHVNYCCTSSSRVLELMTFLILIHVTGRSVVASFTNRVSLRQH